MSKEIIVKEGVVKKKVIYDVPNCAFRFTEEQLEDPAPFNFINKRAFFNWLCENKEAQS